MVRRETDREKGRQTDRKTVTQTHRQTYIQPGRHKENGESIEDLVVCTKYDIIIMFSFLYCSCFPKSFV